MLLLPLSLLFYIIPSSSSKGLTCLDQTGQQVDWFAVYKLPRIEHDPDPYLAKGVAFIYLDSNNIKWQKSSKPITDSDQAVGHTLMQVYKNVTEDIMFAFYNDQKPNRKQSSENHGHTKGAVGANAVSGFWLVQSVPHFPQYYAQGYEYPTTGFQYGQTMLCMSLTMSSMNTVGVLFQYNYPFIYDGYFPPSLADLLPEMKKVFPDAQVRIQTPPYHAVKTLVSLQGSQFLAFAKSSEFGADLYDGLVAPYLKSSLNVETWCHTSSDLPSNCTAALPVCNNNNVSFLGVSFLERDDHSKWAVTRDRGKYTTCIGDINRAVSQEKRGGGTVCYQDKALHTAFYSSIQATEPCADITCPDHPCCQP